MSFVNQFMYHPQENSEGCLTSSEVETFAYAFRGYPWLSCGISGSYAKGIKSSASDIDIFMALPREHFARLIRSKEFLFHFPSSCYSTDDIIGSLESGCCDVYNVKVERNGTKFSVHAYSEETLERLSRLEEFYVARFRDYSCPIHADFRTFTTVADGNRIWRDYRTENLGNGFVSFIPDLVKHGERLFVGSNIDRIFTTSLTLDPIGIHEIQKRLQRGMYAEFLKEGMSDDFFGFLHRRNDIPKAVIDTYRRRIE